MEGGGDGGVEKVREKSQKIPMNPAGEDGSPIGAKRQVYALHRRTSLRNDSWSSTTKNDSWSSGTIAERFPTTEKIPARGRGERFSVRQLYVRSWTIAVVERTVPAVLLIGA